MKILYCIPALYNAAGMERVITEKVNFLIKIPNIEITIVTTDQLQRPIKFKLDERIKVFHFDIDYVGHYSSNLLKKYLLHLKKQKEYKRKLLDLIFFLEIDICISLCGKEIDFLDNLPVKCKKVAEIHFAMNIRKQFMTSHNNGFVWKLLGEIRTKQLINSVKNLDKLVVLTKQDQLQWENYCRNVIQIPNPNPLKNTAVSTLDSNHVITVGRLDPQKGYDLLIEAWSIVHLKHPNWILDIFGHGEWDEKLSNMISKLNLNNSIKLRGLTSDVVSNYLESSIYVMSSRYEGLPMVLIESMSCGLPVVSFDCECGPREIISDGIDGFLVEPTNTQVLAAKICILIEDNQLRIEMGKQALNKSLSYASELVMPKWLMLFDEIV